MVVGLSCYLILPQYSTRGKRKKRTNSFFQCVFLSLLTKHVSIRVQTLLVNGRGQYGCSLAAHYSNNSSLSQCNVTGHEQWAPYILHVDPNKTYRIRLSSTTALASLNLAIGVSICPHARQFKLICIRTARF